MLMFIMWHINDGNNLSDKITLFCFGVDFARNFIKYNKGVIIRGLKAIKSDKGEEGVGTSVIHCMATSVMLVQTAPPASHSWVCGSGGDVMSVMWPWPSLTHRLVPDSVLRRTQTSQTHTLSCCCAVSELSKLISFTSTAPPPLSSSIYHHSFSPRHSAAPPVFSSTHLQQINPFICFLRGLFEEVAVRGCMVFCSKAPVNYTFSIISMGEGGGGEDCISVCVYSLPSGPPGRGCLVGTLGGILGHKKAHLLNHVFYGLRYLLYRGVRGRNDSMHQRSYLTDYSLLCQRWRKIWLHRFSLWLVCTTLNQSESSQAALNPGCNDNAPA